MSVECRLSFLLLNSVFERYLCISAGDCKSLTAVWHPLWGYITVFLAMLSWVGFGHLQALLPGTSHHPHLPVHTWVTGEPRAWLRCSQPLSQAVAPMPHTEDSGSLPLCFLANDDYFPSSPSQLCWRMDNGISWWLQFAFPDN